jgi:hypothetical protein
VNKLHEELAAVRKIIAAEENPAWNIDRAQVAALFKAEDTGGGRSDTGKLRYDLLPPGPIRALVSILTGGATKYGDRNWEKGMAWSRCYASTMRHMMAWYAGEDKDKESGESHLAHAMCNLVFLMEYERTHPEKDDRAYKS